jgi:hypothetical protein
MLDKIRRRVRIAPPLGFERRLPRHSTPRNSTRCSWLAWYTDHARISRSTHTDDRRLRRFHTPGSRCPGRKRPHSSSPNKTHSTRIGPVHHTFGLETDSFDRRALPSHRRWRRCQAGKLRFRNTQHNSRRSSCRSLHPRSERSHHPRPPLQRRRLRYSSGLQGTPCRPGRLRRTPRLLFRFGSPGWRRNNRRRAPANTAGLWFHKRGSETPTRLPRRTRARTLEQTWSTPLPQPRYERVCLPLHSHFGVPVRSFFE